MDDPSGGDLSVDFSTIRPLAGATGNYLEAKGVVGGDLVVHFFGSLDDGGERSVALDAAEGLLRHPHPNILRAIAACRDEGRWYVAFEKFEGTGLWEVLRRRGHLAAGEALAMLEQLAAAVDHTREHEIAGLDLRVAGVRLVAPGGSVSPEVRLDHCRGLLVKVATCGSHPASAKTARYGPESRENATMWAFGRVACELLGCTAGNRHRVRFIPLPGLTSVGNALMRRFLDPSRSPDFESASAFVRELKRHASEDAEGLPPARAKSAPYADSRHRSPPAESARKAWRPAWAPSALALVLLAGVAVAFKPLGHKVLPYWRTLAEEWKIRAASLLPPPEPVVVTTPPPPENAPSIRLVPPPAVEPVASH